MRTLLDLLRFGPQIAYGGGGGGGSSGGGGGGSSDSGSSSSTPTRTEQQVQDDINQALKDSGNQWTSELNDLVAERDDVRAGGTTTTTTTTTSSSSSKPTTTTSSSSDDDRKVVGGMIKGNTIGQVSKNGQYAGDGFEWVETETTGGSKFLTRTYTGAGKDNGLGQDTIFGSTAQKDMKETIAKISLDEGSAFASSSASATDIPANTYGIPTGFFPSSGSYAEQVGQTDYTPTMQYGDSESAASNTFAETFAEERSKQGDGGTFTYEGNQYTTDLAPEVDTSLRPQARPEPEVETGPAFDYTGVSMGEAGRGAPEGTQSPGTFNYTLGTDPEMEMLKSLKDTDPGLLTSGERLKVNQYEKDQAGDRPVSTGIQTASAGPITLEGLFPTDEDAMSAQEASFDYTGASELDPFGGPGPDITPTVSEPEETKSLQKSVFDFIPDPVKYFLADAPENVGSMFTGLGGYLDKTSPLSFGDGNNTVMTPTMALVDQINKLVIPESQKQDLILSADPDKDPSAVSNLLTGIGTTLRENVAPAVKNYLTPEGPQGAFVGDTFGDVTVADVETGQQLTGGDAAKGIVNTSAGEVGDVALDVALSLNPVTRGLSAALNAGEQLTGFSEGISKQIDDAYVAGQLDNNPIFQKALKAQGGDVDKALGAVKNYSYVASNESLLPGYAKIAAAGSADAFVPGLSKGNKFIGLAKEGVKRGAVEGAQGAYESYAAISAVNDALGTNFDPYNNIVGAGLTEAVAGTGAGTVTSLVGQGLTANQRRQSQDAAFANQANMEQAAGTQGIASFAAPGTAVAQPVQTAPNVTTNIGGLDVTASPTFGELAGSTVDTAYDTAAIGQDSPVALLNRSSPPGLGAPTSMDIMAASEIIDNQISETGTVSPEVLTNLQTATGLSMAQLNNIASSSPSITGDPRTSDLTDEVTGIGGGSNITVEPLPSGETLLRNNRTGRETVVNEGANLSEAIQVFDEVSTPLEAPAADTTPNITGITSALPNIDMATIADLNQAQAKNIDTTPVLPGQVNLPTRADNVQLASAPAAEDGSVTIDRGTPTITEGPGSDVGGLEGEILQGEVGPAENVVDDEGIIIDAEVIPDAEQITDQTVVDVDSTIPPVRTTPLVTGSDTDSTLRPLTEVEPPVPPTPEEPVVGEPDDDGGVTVDLPVGSPTFVATVTTENEDGETETKCPEGYQMVEGPDGPICQKSVETTRMRAGRSLQPYTRLRIPEGYRGPGQRRKTVTTTERAEPITT